MYLAAECLPSSSFQNGVYFCLREKERQKAWLASHSLIHSPNAFSRQCWAQNQIRSPMWVARIPGIQPSPGTSPYVCYEKAESETKSQDLTLGTLMWNFRVPSRVTHYAHCELKSPPHSCHPLGNIYFIKIGTTMCYKTFEIVFNIENLEKKICISSFPHYCQVTFGYSEILSEVMACGLPGIRMKLNIIFNNVFTWFSSERSERKMKSKAGIGPAVRMLVRLLILYFRVPGIEPWLCSCQYTPWEVTGADDVSDSVIATTMGGFSWVPDSWLWPRSVPVNWIVSKPI